MYDGQQRLEKYFSQSVTDKFQDGVKSVHGESVGLRWMEFGTVCRIVARL